ncbi:methionyl-tRNA formyltransferase [Hoeflea sp.]|uniref:methionyl-tRNA formyltransferase n=1 Tax=Hoeflea sp. TaxID=1940281 RepID=UPI003A8D4992
MRIGIFGRTNMLLNTARALKAAGNDIPLIWTCGSDEYYSGTPDDYEGLATEYGATYRRRLPAKTEEFIDIVLTHQLDIGISINWLTLMSKEMIEAFPHRILNAHAGDLPRYRGNAAANWAILAGEPHIGLCIHEMTPDLDAGPVYLREHLPLSPGVYIGDVYDWLDARAPEMFATAISNIRAGTQPTPQDLSVRTVRGYPRKPEDSKIAWSLPTTAIHRLIRASSKPFQGAFSFLEDGQLVSIWRAEPYDDGEDFRAVPGQVCFAVQGDPVIATGDGMIRLTEIEIAGSSHDKAKRQVLHSLRNRLIG